MKKYILKIVAIGLLVVSCSKQNNLDSDSTEVITFTSKIRGKNIVISYDDTPLEDYTYIYNLHKRLNIPGEISIWVNNLKDISGKEGALSILQLKEMENWGFEMASHSYYHTGLAPGVLLTDIKPGDNKLKTHINSVFTWGAIVPYNFEITNGLTTEFVKISSVDGSFINLKEPIVNSFLNGAIIQHSEEGLFKELVDSKHYLESKGLKIKHFSYPFGVANERTHRYCKLGGYASARNATPKRNLGKVKVVYEEEIENMYSINSLDLAYLTKEEVVELLDKPKGDNVFIIFFSHSWDKNLTEDKVEFLVKEGKKRNYKFTTRTNVFGLK